MTRRKKFLKTPAERQRACRGNTTSGPDRRGNKAGRPPAYPPGTQVWSWNVTLSDAHSRKAKALGHGNTNAGIRNALDRVEAPAQYADAPQTMTGLCNWIALQRTSNAFFSQEKLDYEDEQQEKAFREEEAKERLESEPPEAPESLSELLTDDKDDDDETPEPLPGEPIPEFDMFTEIENAPQETGEDEYG
jgi:hypothetical protein